MTRTLLVVGHGMVGHRLVERLRVLDGARTWRIVILAEEHHPAYDRVGLSSYLDGKSRSDLTLAGVDFLNDPRVELLLGCSVVSVTGSARTVLTDRATGSLDDALVMATGSRPFVPPVPGRDLPVVSCTAPSTTLMPCAPPPAPGGLVSSSEGGFSGWKRRTPCDCSACTPTSWRQPPT